MMDWQNMAIYGCLISAQIMAMISPYETGTFFQTNWLPLI